MVRAAKTRWVEMQTWPALAKAAGHCGGGDLLYVGVGHDNQRAVGAQLHGDLLDAGIAADLIAHFHAAGEGDFADVGRARDGVTDLGPGASDGLYGFFGQSSLQQDLRQLQGGQWGVAGGLQESPRCQRRGPGPTLWHTRFSGKLKGAMAATTAHRHTDGETELANHAGGGVQRARSRRVGAWLLLRRG